MEPVMQKRDGALKGRRVDGRAIAGLTAVYGAVAALTGVANAQTDWSENPPVIMQ